MNEMKMRRKRNRVEPLLTAARANEEANDEEEPRKVENEQVTETAVGN